jgi:hypothetical protein
MAPNLSRVFARVRGAVKAYRGWEAARLLRRSIAIAPDILTNYITERATATAIQIVLATLDREGLLHCARCPTRAPLHNVGDFKACTKHLGDMQQRLYREQEAEAEKKRLEAIQAKGGPRVPIHMKVAV